ncbi:hypothetical protein MMC20_000289 [Loxospora ochrophaea]|nr:hypothetical protein [Loxospora ochrophaea]
MAKEGHPPEWQPLIKHCLVAGEEVGHSINPDHNSGDAEGLAVAQFNVGEGARTTSVTAFLHPGARSKLGNLTVVTRALGARILFEGKKAVGMELIPATGDVSSSQISVFASKEVILTAGTFASPQLLLLSGVGPANDLARMGIPLVHDLPAVGQNMQDHSAVACEIVIDKSIAGHNQLLNDPDALNAAHKQYKESKTGPLAMFGASAAVIFPHLPSLYTTRAFHDLPASTQEFLTAPGRPSTEIWTHGGPLFYQGPCPPDASVLCLEGLCQNNLSRGTVKLASRNPRDLPIIDPKYLSHPFDLHIALETLKELLKLANSPALSRITESILHGPRNPNDKTKLASSSDEDILEAFIRETMVMGFHAMSTCVMGSPEQKDKVVGNDFRVDGIEGLRVADLSVCPILTTNHTQINAYLIGERCADLVLGKA